MPLRRSCSSLPPCRSLGDFARKKRPHERETFFGRTERPLWAATSAGRCNTGVKSLCRGFELQGLAWPFVELTRHFVEMGLRVHRQVGSLRKVLSQQTISVLIGTALPRALRIAEVNVDVGR